MCQICSDWEKGKLTSKEAFANIGEMLNTTDDNIEVNHLLDLSNRILDKDLPLVALDEEMDDAYWKETHEE